jgi:hypothetical protein
VELDDEVPLTEGSLLLVFDPRKNMSGIINLLGPRLFFSPVGTNISKLSYLSNGTYAACKKLEMKMFRLLYVFKGTVAPD